jgi:tRNA U55 pseudouridine synthase TruB
MSNESQSRPGNQSALQHGGAAAVKAIQKGEPLRGPARQAELAVYEELETEGRYHVVRRDAARLQAAADCYWGALNRLMNMAEQRGVTDAAIIKLTNAVKTFGWLTSAALRAWEQVRREEPAAGRLADYEVLLDETD